MISPTGYKLTCDHTHGCDEQLYNVNRFQLCRRAEAANWTLNRKLNGEYALRGGRDYCPRHRRTP